MAKAKSTSSMKVNFGKRREGKAKKRKGPKDKPTKKLRKWDATQQLQRTLLMTAPNDL